MKQTDHLPEANRSKTVEGVLYMYARGFGWIRIGQAN